MKSIKDLMGAFVVESQEIDVEEQEVKAYLKKFDNKLSENVKLVIMLTLQYKILSKETITNILTATKSKLKTFAAELNLDSDVLVDLQKELKILSKKNELNQLPQMLGSDKLRKLLKDGADFDENTMDFTTQAGQNFIVKKYTPVLKLLVSKWEGKSALDKEELWSIAYSALTYAMQTYNSNKKVSLPWALGNEIKVANKEDEEEIEQAEEEAIKSKGASFNTYLSRCVEWAFLYEMKRNSRVVRRPASEIQKNNEDDNDSANFDTSIDAAFGDADAASTDHYKFLGVDSELDSVPNDIVSTKVWTDFINSLKKHNSERDVIIFMKAWGIGGEEQMSKSDIAKQFGVSQPMISKIVKKILTEIQSDKKYRNILMALKDTFMESFGMQYFNKDCKTIVEALRSNDLYIMLEEITNYDNKIIECIYNNFSDDDMYLFGDIINKTRTIEECFDRNKYIKFLNHFDIFENHNSWSYDAICNKMHKILD